jgi:hypothetical protein
MPVRGPEFRYVYANSITYSMSDHDVKLVFGVVEDHNNPEKTNEQTGVMMTHKTAKLLATLLNETLSHFERTTKTTIPLEKEKIESLRQALDAANQPRS